jgi:glycosyltransferase involved in cell wall biosynthesis
MRSIHMNVSVLILTLNEEINIASCLDTLSWSDDIVVLDSYSQDATVRIATERGARVVQRSFDNWSAHQNWAVETIEFRNPWVLYLDADERCPTDLRDEVLFRALPEAPEDAFRMRRKDFYSGKWLRHAQLYPSWFVRLFRPKKIRYQRLVNPVATVDGPVGRLDGHLLHYPFSHGVAHWIARHNKYSDFEAKELFNVRNGATASSVNLFSPDPNKKRRALKDLFYRLPARPLIKFMYYYIWRRGFLDGRPGLTYSTLQSIYEYMIDCKYRELRRRERGLPV